MVGFGNTMKARRQVTRALILLQVSKWLWAKVKVVSKVCDGASVVMIIKN